MARAEPRQHHILPVFYLAGFTDTGSSDGQCYVFDYTRSKRYRSSPRQICREKDYFRIHEPDRDPFLIERTMAEVEAAIAPVLQRIVRRGKAVSTSEVGALLNLAALVAARDRRGRLNLARGLAESLEDYLARGAITKEKWDKIRSAELRAGLEPAQIPEYERAIELVRSGDWKPRAPQILQVGMVAEIQQYLLKILQRREWELLITDAATNGGFICSDSPLVWGSLDDISDGELLASLDDLDSEVTFPVAKNLALVSYADAGRCNSTATDNIVAHVNMRTLQLSMGLVFHSATEFLLRRRSGEIRPASEYFNYVDRARRDGLVRP